MIMISQLRNNLLFDAQVEYNCSYFNASIDWSKKGTQQPIFGIICMLCGVICIVPYLACLVIMWKKRNIACYKMMFFLGVNDVFLLVVVCFFAGAIFATGGVYCHNPKMHFIVCMCAFVGFFASCSTCFLIALNRVVEMLHIHWLAWLYQGNRPWYGMAAPLLLGLFAALFTPIAFFNSDLHIVHFDPMISDKYEYANVLHAVNNILFPTASLLLYVIMVLQVRATSRKTTRNVADSSVNRAALVLSVQCGVIVCVHMSTCVGYLALQFIPSSEGLRYIAHFGWILLHGLPPFVYLIFNRSIRRSFVQMTSPNSRVTTHTGQLGGGSH